jgi:hypothetical protein
MHSAVILMSCFIFCKRPTYNTTLVTIKHSLMLKSLQFALLSVGFQVFTEVKNNIFGDVTLCNSIEVHRYFE